MNFKILFAFIFVIGCAQAFAADGKITISFPAHGAMINAKDKLPINYDAVLGPGGDHLHLYVDGARIDVLRQLTGSTEVGPLTPGIHHICLAENTKWHMATGPEDCIEVTAQ
jgi:hypothetical protein